MKYQGLRFNESTIDQLFQNLELKNGNVHYLHFHSVKNIRDWKMKLKF